MGGKKEKKGEVTRVVKLFPEEEVCRGGEKPTKHIGGAFVVYQDRQVGCSGWRVWARLWAEGVGNNEELG